MLYIYVFDTFFYTLSYANKITNILVILDIGDWNTNCVFASKGTYAAYLHVNNQ